MSKDFNIEVECSLFHIRVCPLRQEAEVDMVDMDMVLMLLFQVKLDCCVFWTVL